MKTHDPGRLPAVVHGLYRAFFTEDVDISRPDVAATVAARHGADETAVRAAIDDPAVKESLKGENERALRRGVFGSPFTIVDDEPFWGIDRFDQVDRWLATGGW